MALLLAVLVDDRKLEGIRPVKIKKRCNLSTEELFRNQRGSSSGPNFFLENPNLRDLEQHFPPLLKLENTAIEGR